MGVVDSNMVVEHDSRRKRLPGRTSRTTLGRREIPLAAFRWRVETPSASRHVPAPSAADPGGQYPSLWERSRVNEEQEVIAAQGTKPQQETWTLMYQTADGQRSLRLLLNGGEHDAASGFDIPDVAEIGFSCGLTPGHGLYFLYGLATSRIKVVRAESHEADRSSEVMTAALPGATASDGTPLRTCVLVRPPIDDVSALVGLDQAGPGVTPTRDLEVLGARRPVVAAHPYVGCSGRPVRRTVSGAARVTQRQPSSAARNGFLVLTPGSANERAPCRCGTQLHPGALKSPAGRP